VLDVPGSKPPAQACAGMDGMPALLGWHVNGTGSSQVVVKEEHEHIE